MPQPFDVAAGFWWRFSRYELRDSHIHPAPGAKLERYDPWEDYRVVRASEKDTRPPYQSLLDLFEGITFRPIEEGQPFALSPESEAMTLSWYAEHGPLGVLIQRVHSVFLAPRWEPFAFKQMEEIKQEDRVSEKKSLLPALRSYHRTNLGWRGSVRKRFGGENSYSLIDEPEMHGQLVADEYLPRTWPRPSALIQRLRDFDWEEESLSKTWARFFPQVGNDERETFPYPLPMSKEFWDLYSEPVDEFLNGAMALRDAVSGLAHIKPLDKATEDDNQQLGRGIRTLHALVAPVSPTLNPLSDGSFEQRWVSPSLLASYAMMVLQDLTEQRRILRCEVCGKLFTSAAYQARYCSDTCRHTAQKRRYRAKKREN